MSDPTVGSQEELLRELVREMRGIARNVGAITFLVAAWTAVGLIGIIVRLASQ
jgi:hypothetical protein